MTKKWLIMAVAAAIICNTAGCISSEANKLPKAIQRQLRPPISAESEQFLTQGLAAYGKFQYDSAAIALYDKALEADKGNYKSFVSQELPWP